MDALHEKCGASAAPEDFVMGKGMIGVGSTARKCTKGLCKKVRMGKHRVSLFLSHVIGHFCTVPLTICIDVLCSNGTFTSGYVTPSFNSNLFPSY